MNKAKMLLDKYFTILVKNIRTLSWETYIKKKL